MRELILKRPRLVAMACFGALVLILEIAQCACLGSGARLPLAIPVALLLLQVAYCAASARFLLSGRR